MKCSPLQQSYSMTCNKKTGLQISQNKVVKFVWIRTSTSLQLVFLLPFKISNVELLQKWLNIYLLSPSIFIVVYRFLKADDELVTMRVNHIFPKFKEKKKKDYHQEFCIFPAFSPFVEYICYNFAPRTTAVALYLSNLKKQLVLAILMRTSKDN